MRYFGKQISAIAMAVILSIGMIVSAAADTQSQQNDRDTSDIHITVFSADGTADSVQVIPTVKEDQWQPSCLSQPYDYEYQDEFRMISINRIYKNNITYFAVDVQIKDAAYMQTALSSNKPHGGLELVSDLAVRSAAVLAINGDDYGTHQYGTIIRNGALIRANATTRNMLIVNQFGDMSVHIDRKGEDAKALGQQLLADAVWQTFEFGPELVRDGEAVSFSSAFDVISTNSTRREPRTAIGQIDTLHYIIIVADGRQDGYSVGMTLPELQDLFVHYGAQTAMNLDGGGSTELWFQGQILNRPAGGEERYVSDIIFF